MVRATVGTADGVLAVTKDVGISFEAGSDAPKPYASRAPGLTLKFGLKKRRFSAVLDQVREWHGDLSQRTEAKSRLDSS